MSYIVDGLEARDDAERVCHVANITTYGLASTLTKIHLRRRISTRQLMGYYIKTAKHVGWIIS